MRRNSQRNISENSSFVSGVVVCVVVAKRRYLSNNDTLLSEDGIKTLNAYALKGYRLITDYPLFDKPTSREEFLDAFNVAMQFYEKKDS